MKTIIKGYKKTNTYSYKSVAKVNEAGEKEFTETCAPIVDCHVNKEASEIMFEIPEKIVFNDMETDLYDACINISETEIVNVIDYIYRADLNEVHVIVDKNVVELDEGKEEAEALMAAELKEFRSYIITHNKEYKDYCDLNKLVYEDTDLDVLRKVLRKVLIKGLEKCCCSPNPLIPAYLR